VVGTAIWHESNTDEHRKGDPKHEEDREALLRRLVRSGILLGGVRFGFWKSIEKKVMARCFFELFEEYMRSKGYERIVFYANHPATLAICRKRGYKKGGCIDIEGEVEYVFYLPLRKK